MHRGGYKATATMFTAALAALILVVAPLAQAQNATTALKELGDAFVQIADKVTPAVVNISSTKKVEAGPMSGPDMDMFKNHPFREFFGDEFFKRFKGGPGGPGPDKGFRQHGMGSGVVVSPDGTILTNSHVVKDADDIKVTLSDKRSYKAKVVGADPESDIAVIKIDGKDLPIAKFGDSDKLRVGDIVLAIGNPFGLNQTVTSGIVSAKGRTNVGIIDYEDFLQTDAAINPGNSGGPLVNIKGEVVGLNTAIASRSGGYQGIGFAIPANSAKLIMDSLVKEGKVRRGLLGVNIQDLDQTLAKSFGREDQSGALVSQVIEGSPAEKAGIKAGDIILKFNDAPISGASQLKNLVGRVAPGTKAKLSVYRDKKTMTVDVNIAERDPKKMAELKASPSEGETSNELGLEIEKLPAAMAERLGLKSGEGVRVREVEPAGLGAKMGLRPGDVILEIDGKPVSDTSSFSTAVQSAKKEGLVRLKVQRGKSQIFLAAPIG